MLKSRVISYATMSAILTIGVAFAYHQANKTPQSDHTFLTRVVGESTTANGYCCQPSRRWGCDPSNWYYTSCAVCTQFITQPQNFPAPCDAASCDVGTYEDHCVLTPGDIVGLNTCGYQLVVCGSFPLPAGQAINCWGIVIANQSGVTEFYDAYRWQTSPTPVMRWAHEDAVKMIIQRCDTGAGATTCTYDYSTCTG